MWTQNPIQVRSLLIYLGFFKKILCASLLRVIWKHFSLMCCVAASAAHFLNAVLSNRWRHVLNLRAFCLFAGVFPRGCLPVAALKSTLFSLKWGDFNQSNSVFIWARYSQYQLKHNEVCATFWTSSQDLTRGYSRGWHFHRPPPPPDVDFVTWLIPLAPVIIALASRGHPKSGLWGVDLWGLFFCTGGQWRNGSVIMQNYYENRPKRIKAHEHCVFSSNLDLENFRH